MIRTASWRALGTSVHVVSAGGRPGAARDAVHRVLEEVDIALSRFRADSELVRLNTAAGQAVPVSPLLYGAIAAAIRAAQVTDGLVDPTVGRAMRLAGYDRDFALVRDRAGGADQLVLEAVPGWHAIHLSPTARTVCLEHGIELDLGSTGKALAADLAAQAAHAAADGAVLVSLGGDIAVAGEPPTGGWRILCEEDSAIPTDADGEVVMIRGGGIATSSTTLRRWTRNGVELHHVLDPRTGRPARGPWRTATVAAASCLDANVAATAAIVLGVAAPAWLAGRHLPARLVAQDGTVHRLGGWPIGTGAAA